MLYYSVMYILWGMTYTIMDIPYWSMIPTLATTKEDREKISVSTQNICKFRWAYSNNIWYCIGKQAWKWKPNKRI